MKIIFQPQRRDDTYSVNVLGDALIIDGAQYDFSPLPEGGILPREAVNLAWLASDVTREGGEICVAIIAPIGVEASDAARFPDPIILTDGPVEFPQ